MDFKKDPELMKNIQIEYLFTPKGNAEEIRVHHRWRTEVFPATDENLTRLLNAYIKEPTLQTLYLSDDDVLDHNGVIIDVV